MRVNRLISILLTISSKGIVTGKELADYYEISLRTIYRDIEKLCEAGIPIASMGGKGGGFYIMDNYDLDKLFLDKEELQAITPLMKDLKLLFGKGKQFDDIALKLENASEKGKDNYEKLKINISHFSMEDELKEYLYLISKAIEESKLLEFDYINRRMEYSKRMAQPIQISFKHGMWYLIAFCIDRNDYRKFKLLRMRNLEIGKNFIKSCISNDKLEEYFRNGYEKNSIKVVLRFTNRIKEHLVEHFNKNRLKIVGDSIIVEEQFPHEEGLIKFILSFGRDCEIIEPEYLRNEVHEYLEELSNKYNKKSAGH
jgi:predicted DNA-binding transcriptional regulator YafY